MGRSSAPGYRRLSAGGNPPYRSLSCKLETSGFSPASPFTVHPTIYELFVASATLQSVFTPHICPPRWLENSLRNGLVLFFLHTVYDGGLGHIFIYISCLTHKKKRKICCEWKALLTLATWGESLHSRDRGRGKDSVETFFLSWNTFRNLLTFHLRPLCHCMQLILWTKEQIGGATRSSACEPWLCLCVCVCVCVCDCWRERFIFVYYYYYSPQAVEANTSSRP